MAKIILDSESGEIIGEIGEGDKIIRNSSITEFKNSIDLNKNELFIKVYIKTLFDLSDIMTGAESVFLFYLLSFLSYKDGVIKYSNGKIVTKQHMAKDTKKSVRNIERLLYSLISKEIIGIHKSGENISYTVNPFLFMRGKRIDNSLYDLYKNSQWVKYFDVKELD